LTQVFFKSSCCLYLYPLLDCQQTRRVAKESLSLRF